MGVCNESGRRKNIPDKITYSSNNTNTNKINTENIKTISSSSSTQDNKTNKSLNHRGLISK